MLKSIRLGIVIVVTILIGAACNNQLDIKDFIEKGFDVAKLAQAIEFSPSVTDNAIHYLPSGQLITVTVPIENRHAQELSGTVTIPPGSEGLFLTPPTLKQLTPNKAVIECTFKPDAEPNSASGYIAQSIPMLLALSVAQQNRPFGSFTIPLYCNTPPVKPHPYTIHYNEFQDIFTFNLPDKTGLNKDLDRIKAKVTITAAGGLGQTREYTRTIPLDGSQPNPYIMNLTDSDLFGASPPAGKRDCSLVLFDKTGLSTQLADTAGARYDVRFRIENGQGGSLTAVCETESKAVHGAESGISAVLTVPHGKTISFTAEPETGWEVDSWTVSPAGAFTSGGGNGAATATISSVGANIDISVTFKRSGLPVLKIKQDFSAGDTAFHTIAAAGKRYITEDIVPDAEQYTNTAPLILYNNSGSVKLMLTPPAGSTAAVHCTLNGSNLPVGASGIIALNGSAVYKLEVWAVKDGQASMHTSVHIQVVDGVSSYTVLKNLVKNAPPYGTGGAEYDYTNAIPITLHSDIIAPAGIDTTEMAVADRKKLLLNSSSSGTLRTIDAAGRGRIFNITGTVLTLNSIQLKGGSAADGKGGAVYAGTGGILALSGNTVILPSTGDDENIQGKNDVYADIDNGAAIKVDSTLAASGTVARITPAQYTEGRGVLLGTPADILAHYSKFAITPKSGVRWSVTNAGTLIEKTLTIDGNTGGTWKDLKEAVKAAPEGSAITVKGAVQATNTGSDTAADWGEITIDKNLTIQGEGAAVSMLDANAAALGTNAHRIFYVVSGKTLTLKNLTLTGGEKTADDGGAVFVFSGSTLDMSGCAIESCKADNGGAIYAQGGSAVKLTNTTIKNCEAIGSTGKGGALYVYSSTAAMIRCTLTGNKAKSGGGIYAEKASGGRSTAVTIKGGTIGGIHTADANKADGTGPDGNGGGILIADGCTLTMQDYTDTGGSTYRAELIGNGAQHAGGGICANSNSIITLSNVYINKCTAGNSGGAVYTKGAAAELTNCTLTANTANDGGALCAKTQSGSQSSITVCGGIIGGTNSTDSNKAAGTGAEGNGGGIYIESNCTVTLKDHAAVTGNTAAGDGGGVYTTGGTVTMMDCMLTGNTAAGNGGGVYAAQNNLGGSSAAAAVTMQNAARILPSSGSDIHTKGKNDVYVGGSTMITLVGELTGTVPVARITVADDKYQPTTQVLNGSTGAGTEPNQNYTKFTVTPKDTDEWKISSQGMLVLNATVVDATASSSDAWKKLKDAVAAVFEGGSITVKGTVQATHTGSGTAAANSGEIIIDKNLTIKGEGATAMLDANGSAGGKPPHRIFDVKENKTLILENLTLKNGTGTGDEKGGGLYVRKWAKAKLSHCTIQTCTAKEGGGIAAEGGTVELDTCTLTGNTATIAGGGIYAHTNGSHVSKVIIIGSTIGGTGTGESNTSKYGGGIYVAEKSRLKMTSSAIKKCQALLEGGAIYTKGGTVELDTCTLTGNKGENTGGGLCVRANGSTGASVTIKGGSIGGTGTDEPNITGSSGKGGGIFISGTDSSVTLSDSAAVNGNKAELDGGGIYVDENSRLTVNGSSLAKNTASGKGGGVYIKDASATFTMSGISAITPSSGSEADLPGKNDAYLNGGSKIKLTSDFDPQETAARITPDNYPMRTVLTGASTALNSHHSKFAVTPQNLGGGQKQAWKVADTGFLRKAALTLTINGSDSDAWTKLKTEVEKPSGGAAKIIIEGAVTANSTHKGEITVNREVEITGNSINAVLDAANENRIFKVDTAGKLTVKNLKLTNGHTSGVYDYGSAVYAAGELTVISCEIVENHAEHAGGGGIYIKKDGKCTINGSSTRKTIIGKNKATKGGGLQTDGNCTIGEYTVIGGSGMGNQGTQFGGGIFVSRTGECMVKDGVEISYNTLSSSTTRGGGIYIERTSVSKGKLIVHGTSENPVKITNHTATYGGGIYVEADASIRDAEIKDCTATNGGGMYLDNDAQVKMENNAHITGCTTILNGEGGAIYIKRATAVFTMSGNAVITLSSGNDKNKPGKNDVYFDGGAMIRIDSVLTGTAPAARITVASNKYMDTTQVLTGSKVNTEHLKFAVTPKNGNQYWAVDKNGRLANNFNSIFNTISADVIQAAESSMSTNQINNRKALLDGKLILYKTNRGNYGIMHITEVDNTSGAGHITFNYKTFNTSGTVQKTRNGCNLEGTYSFDLDNESTDQNDKDFWLPNVSTSDESKHFEPKNGALFYTLP